MGLKGALQGFLSRIRSTPASQGAVEPADQIPDDMSLGSMLAGLRANRDHSRDQLAKNPSRRTVERVVDNRVFLLGLEELYRTGIKPHERKELLPAARAVASTFGIRVDDGPVEGYYAEDRWLQEYFHLRRALQTVDASGRPRVEGLPEFDRLLEVMSSPVFGKALDQGGLLPRGRDPLAAALLSTKTWTVSDLIDRAYKIAAEGDDYSLVAMACLAKDPVALIALRDSTVLNFQATTLGQPPIPIYVWNVEPEIVRRGEQFIATFNKLFTEELPSATRENADLFGAAFFERASFIGRCVRIGTTPDKKHYHWAVFGDHDGKPQIHEFVSDELWTTERYRRKLPVGNKGQAKVSS
jgi:hypothetical protein